MLSLITDIRQVYANITSFFTFIGTCYSNDHPYCGQYFEEFKLPNHANQTNPRDALLSTNVFLPLMVANCSEYINRFACYYYLPNAQCSPGTQYRPKEPRGGKKDRKGLDNGDQIDYGNGTSVWGFGTTDYPCRELCYKAQQECALVMEEIGFIWPEDVSCDSLPEAKSLQCDHFGLSGKFVDLPYLISMYFEFGS